MDSSHVSLVSVTLYKDGFEHYRCDKPSALGINFGTLTKILKCASNTDTCNISAADDGDVINFLFESDKQDKISDFEIKLLNIDSEHLGIPATPYECDVELPAAEFQRICRDLNVLGDTCLIKVGKEGVTFSVDGDMGKANITLKDTKGAEDKEEEAVTIRMEEEIELKFALRYLNFFTKATPLSTKVKLSMSKEVPLAVEYKLEGKGFIRYYLAPKVDEGA